MLLLGCVRFPSYIEFLLARELTFVLLVTADGHARDQQMCPSIKEICCRTSMSSSDWKLHATKAFSACFAPHTVE